MSLGITIRFQCTPDKFWQHSMLFIFKQICWHLCVFEDFVKVFCLIWQWFQSKVLYNMTTLSCDVISENVKNGICVYFSFKWLQGNSSFRNKSSIITTVFEAWWLWSQIIDMIFVGSKVKGHVSGMVLSGKFEIWGGWRHRYLMPSNWQLYCDSLDGNQMILANCDKWRGAR